jgi:hypothetical protein
VEESLVPRITAATKRSQSPGGERVFTDEKGRLWSAAHAGEAIVFTCVSDGRESGRAIASTDGDLSGKVGDEELRMWLGSAPRIGRLT